LRAAHTLDSEVRSLQAAHAAKAATDDGWPVPPAWFVQDSHCIAVHESGDGTNPAAGGNIYGMLDGWAQAGGSGVAGEHSRAEQLYRVWVLYNWALGVTGDGWSPWRGDGCYS